jgi:hypothetical protein
MRSGKLVVVLGGLAVGALACEESATAPGVCPDFCPTGEIQVVDTVLVEVLKDDISYTGYAVPNDAVWMQVVGGGAVVEARSVVWFPQFGDSASIDSLTEGPVIGLDSFRLDLVLVDHTPIPGLEVTVHRVPPSLDRESDFAALAPFFEDSTIIGTVVIADSLTSDTVSAIIPVDAFPTFEEDSQQVAVGLSIRGSQPAFATFETREANLGSLMNRFVKIEGPESDTVEQIDFIPSEFDGFVDTDLPPPTGGSLVIGGTPASRTFMTVAIPSFIMDSSDVVRAQLLLVPSEPALGGPLDTFELVAEPLGADFGAKSPILASLDTLLVKTPVGVGTMDTVAVDISRIVVAWQSDTTQVRTLVVRARFEAATVAELRLGSTQIPGFEPVVRVTYVPPFTFVQ